MAGGQNADSALPGASRSAASQPQASNPILLVSPDQSPAQRRPSVDPVHQGSQTDKHVDSGKLLPKVFAGWMASSIRTSTNPSDADSANPAVLREYGFEDLESTTYTRPGRSMTVRAARFHDASGAYGAFTFYKTPEMLNEKFGDQGATRNELVLFYKGNVLVEVKLDRVTPMSAGELRELAEAIPLPDGSARNLPTLPQYLPKQSYVKNSAKYVLGPIAYATLNAMVPADAIDFARGAEVSEGNYESGEGIATLLLVGYPTPAIAGERERAIQALNPRGASPIYSKRTGPLLVLISGSIDPAEAKTLLASVNYDADVTWNENTYFGKRDNLANLLVNVIALIGIILGLALVAGLAFGGLRVLLARLFPGRIFDRPEEAEIIRLNLGK